MSLKIGPLQPWGGGGYTMLEQITLSQWESTLGILYASESGYIHDKHLFLSFLSGAACNDSKMKKYPNRPQCPTLLEGLHAAFVNPVAEHCDEITIGIRFEPLT